MSTALPSTMIAGLAGEPGTALPRIDAGERTRDRAVPLPVTLAVLAAVLGSGALLPFWVHMSGIWTNDPLRAIGAWFPLISLLGVLREWRRLGWPMRGSAWGMVPVALAALACAFSFFANPRLTVYGDDLSLTPWGATLFAYAAGVILLFGGRSLLRASLLPLCLLLCVNPVPHVYNLFVDLPLQQISAATARAFAHCIGLYPSGQQLRMMFAPDFGMMIVPGCNGVRGSVTLAYLSLIFGYARGLRSWRLAAVTALGFCSGFALNLLRLCLLVVYYRVGLAFPSIQPYGAGIDYAIGGTVFLLATAVLGLLIRRLGSDSEPALTFPPLHENARCVSARGSMWRACALAGLAFAVVLPQRHLRARGTTPVWSESSASRFFPNRVGEYRLVRSYGEQDARSLVFILADYEQAAIATHPASGITLGFWLADPGHLVALSKKAQGLHPSWVGSFDASEQSHPHMHFYSTFFDDGQMQQYNAETICSAENCSAWLPSAKGIHFQINHVNSWNLARSRGKHLSLLLRREWPEDAGNPDELRQHFEKDARGFLHDFDIQPVLQAAGRES